MGSPKSRVCDKGLSVSSPCGNVAQGAGVRERKSETGIEAVSTRWRPLSVTVAGPCGCSPRGTTGP